MRKLPHVVELCAAASLRHSSGKTSAVAQVMSRAQHVIVSTKFVFTLQNASFYPIGGKLVLSLQRAFLL